MLRQRPWLQIRCLDASLSFRNAGQYCLETSPAAVFLTGGTGFLGASILYELLKQDIPTYWLVGADDTDAARQWLVDTLTQYSL